MNQQNFDKLLDELIVLDKKLSETTPEELYASMIVNEVIKIIEGFSKSTTYLRRILIQSFAHVTEMSISTACDYLTTHSQKVLSKKALEYAAPESESPDRLHNFKSAYFLFNIEPDKFCINLMLKHIISIIDILQGKVDADMAMIKEKWLDAYNYCILLEAIKEERDET